MSRLRSASALFSLVVASGLQWGCATPQEKEARFLERGKQHLQSKDYGRAILELRNAVALAPKDAEAYSQLGLAFLQQGDLRNAAAAMKRATELDPRNAAAQVKLAELYALAGDEDAAKQGKARMHDVLSDAPDNPDALTALALAELRLGDLGEGEQHLEQALGKFPQNLQSAMILARLKLELRDFDAAEQVLKQAVQRNPGSIQAAQGLAEFYRLRGRWTDAEGQFQNLLKIDPGNPMAWDGLAAVQLRSGRKDQAEQSYRRLAALPDKRYQHRHAAYLFQEGQRDAAIAEFASLARQDPKDKDARIRLLSAYLVAGRASDAEKVLAAALKADPKDVDALLRRAFILLRVGKADAAQADLTQVLRYQPNAPLAHYLLSKVHQAHGEGRQRIQELGETLRLQPDLLGVRIELAQAWQQANQAKAALDVMNNAAPSQRNLLPYIAQRNWALLATGDQTELGKGVAQGLALRRTADLLLQGGLLELERRNYSGARTYFAEALERNPEDLRSLEALARSYAEQGQLSVGLQKVREYATRRPKSAQMQEYLGEQLQISGNPAEARKAFNAARAADPAYTRADLALAQLDLNEGRAEDARKRVSGALSGGKDVLPARFILGDIETKAGHYAAAIEQYRLLLEAAPRNARALNDIAYLLVEYQNRPDEALKYAQEAAEILPGDTTVEDTIGWVFYHKGLYVTAVQYLKSAAENGNLVAARYHLAMAYLKAGQRDLGKQVLEDALRMDPNVPEARMAKEVLEETRSVAK